jgi:hypothetical protein
VFSTPDGKTVVKTRASGHPSEVFEIARRAYEDLARRGAFALLG